MEGGTIDKFNKEYPAYNALYHAVKGLIFLEGDYAHKVTNIRNDENDRNLKISNEKRLKNRLFKEIKRIYNVRIDKYGLSFNKISESQKNDTEIVKFRLVKDTDREKGDYSGEYMIFPRAFVCSECGDLIYKAQWKELSIFNPRRCRKNGCVGKYEQVSIVLFCEECGKIKPLRYRCPKHGYDDIRLIRGKKDSLVTWKVVCQKCLEKRIREPIDIFWLTCDHRGYKKISGDEEKTKLKPLTIKEGGVYTPVTTTLVDIPQTESIDLNNLEYILLGLYLGEFNEISDKIENKVSIEEMESYIRTYKDKNIKNLLFSNDPSFKGIKLEEKEIKWKKNFFVDIIERVVRKLNDEYRFVDLENFNDYFAVLNKEPKKYNEYIANLDDEQKHLLELSFQELKTRYGIEDIKYIPSINLVTSCIGIINGINKFYDRNFIPHFSPIWESKRKDKMIIYAYPFETEGILIDLNKIQVCNWLSKNDLIGEIPSDSSRAKNILLKIKEGSEGYRALKELLHTLSHALIRRSSLYTGLDSDSCGELIFVNSAAIFVYPTSNTSIGGFEFVFEHSLRDWFGGIEFEVKECTFDPACIAERGACFSCLYLPEYVCKELNQYLDRDVFIGKERYNVGYWQCAE